MGIIKLSEVKNCSPTVMWFYDKFRPQIADATSMEQINRIENEMDKQFKMCIKGEPDCEEDLTSVYRLLKRKCMEAL